MELKKYFGKNQPLVIAVKDFFEGELAIELKNDTEQALSIDSILGKDFKHNDKIDKLYFAGGISDKTFTKEGPGETSLLIELNKNTKYQALFVFAINLKESKAQRTVLTEITRKLNRISETSPVIAIYKYGNKLSLATTERTPKEKNEGEKIGKISLLKDIEIDNAHSGHLRILRELRIPTTGKNAVSSFESLYKYWRSVFNLKVLNEKFYEELFFWYLWAIRLVEIPVKPKGEKLGEDALRSIFVIRLITRLMFVWFVKEKKLVPSNLFSKNELEGLLKKFKADSSENSIFYRAILQNLFFATLNTPLRKEAKDHTEERRFIDLSKKGSRGFSEGYTDQTLYRYQEYFIEPEKAIELFDPIPFLNGGLFECLDFPENKSTGEAERRYDGFSSTKEKQAFVPDVLFFGNEIEIDVTKDLEDESDKKKKVSKRIVKVRGILKTLNDYKFTIAENTPLEEEIALDPELLGKVFENLLASYNPETKGTARKQTGSFYTPREIVSYMVDESLKMHLFEKLSRNAPALVELGKKQTQMFGNDVRKGQTELIQEVALDKTTTEEINSKLNNLFDYSIDGNPFDEVETDLLVRAISNCKILDPACGSGAFPMGILHRMVHLLTRLDPNNKKWKEELLRKAEGDLELAKRMDDKVIREKAIEGAELRIDYIKESFGNNKHEFDYTRKLFLIEHCIYGLDIQQIAVQISKLRFFISLMVDQHVDDSRPNRNVLSMPNLETKFVAANSLIGLDQNVSGKKNKGSGFLRSLEVELLEIQLKELRKEVFYTRRYSDKKKLKKGEEELRAKLKDALVKSGMPEKSAKQMANWNPFDPIHSASFFHSETMFGFDNGFDIVIGNPPYYQIQKLDDNQKKPLEDQQYETYSKSGDLYCLFYEKGVRVLSKNGILCYITSNKWMRTDYGESVRTFLGTKTKTKIVVDFGMAQMFESATTYTNIMTLSKASPADTINICRMDGDYTVELPLAEYIKDKTVTVENPKSRTWIAYKKAHFPLINKIIKQGIPLAKWNIKINRGILTGFNDAFIINDEIKERLVQEDPKSGDIIKPILRGEDIKAYFPDWAGKWLINTHNGIKSQHVSRIDVVADYKAIYKWLRQHQDKLEKRLDQGDHWTNLRNCAYIEEFEKPKIIYPNMTKFMPFVYDKGSFFINDKAFMITGESLGYLTAFFSSRLFKFCFKEFFPELLGDSRELRKVFFETIPVKPGISEDWFEKRVLEIQEGKIKSESTNSLETTIETKLWDYYELTQKEREMILKNTDFS